MPWLLALLALIPVDALAAPGLDAVTVVSNPDGSQSYSLTLQVLVFMTIISVLPGLLLVTTSFTRIIIVLALLRQAMGAGTTPSNQILLGLALFLTAFIMMPVFERMHETAIAPYLEEKMSAEQAFIEAQKPLRSFMLAQIREDDLAMFTRLSGREQPYASTEEIPMTVMMPSFLISELKTAFQIGFMLFIPFLIIDIVVASVLMSMGMMMLSPMIISLPFKIMLFVVIDGWSLVASTLARSFVP
ncbi:MAG: flagellar type III secretion system pore protein FliP [Gammaproteobacteria bacterium SHHR-1]|uniref:flagellar type III secretion system pore protein FliP n=1 Tax=Magnetovirga frankeli TaxID=947516 RepID=UPI001293B1CD|nr:flagellar type III secretion system pore protein FliP [gamma proteobacterium SS-5]